MNNLFEFLGLEPIKEELKPYTEKANYPSMDPNLRKKLVTYFKPYNKQLEELLGIKLKWD